MSSSRFTSHFSSGSPLAAALPADPSALYQRLFPPAFWDEVCQRHHLRQNNRVYTLAVVIWLIICQWLQGHASLERAVLELLRGLPAEFWPRPCKRLQDARSHSASLSGHTAAYNQARHRLPLPVVEQCCDHLFEQLTAQTDGALPGLRRRAFFFDGTSVQLPHSPALHQRYPPGSNQHGASHWPLLRMLVAHDLTTGLALPPQWGPANGPQAVSEQQLLDIAIARLPVWSLVVGDANFGVFSVAYAADRREHPVLLRLTLARALRLAGGPLRDGICRPVTWKPTREDRRSHPGLPADACVEGRLVVCEVQPSDQATPLLLALFTTWEGSVQDLLEVYGRRWCIGVSSQGHIVQSVKDRPRPKDSGVVAGEAPWRESKTAEPSDNILGKECAQRTRLQRTVNADVASLHESPVAETVDNARKQQGLAETSPIRQLSPAGYQRRHGVKEDVETGEALGARRRNLVEEMPAITASGKCGQRRQGDGSGRSTGDGRAAKRARREGPVPVSIPLTKVRQG